MKLLLLAAFIGEFILILIFLFLIWIFFFCLMAFSISLSRQTLLISTILSIFKLSRFQYYIRRFLFIAYLFYFRFLFFAL